MNKNFENYFQETLRGIRDMVPGGFPEIRELFGDIKLIASFSHSNPNLPVNEVYGNFFLDRLIEEAGIEPSSVMNIAYDNPLPSSDSPRGDRIQYSAVNPVIMEPDIPYSFQKDAVYQEGSVFKGGINILHSIPDENRGAFSERIDRVHKILKSSLSPGGGGPSGKILQARREFLALTGIGKTREVPFSGPPTELCTGVLEKLCLKGYPFWEMELPREYEKYRSNTFFVEGIDRTGRRNPVKIRNGFFEFKDIDGVRKIHRDDIFSALRSREVIPTMPLVVLGLSAGPGIPHLGGRVWPVYGRPIAGRLIKWLGLGVTSEDIIKTTGGLKSLGVYKKERSYYGFPLVYATFGRKEIRNRITSPSGKREELQRRVYPSD